MFCILFRIESSCIQVTIVDFTKEHLRILERKMQSLPKKNGKIGRVQDLWSSGTKMNCSVRSTEYWFHSFLGTCK